MATIKVGYVVQLEISSTRFWTRAPFALILAVWTSSRLVLVSSSFSPVCSQPIFLISIKTCQKFLAAEIPSNYAISDCGRSIDRSNNSVKLVRTPKLKIQNRLVRTDNSDSGTGYRISSRFCYVVVKKSELEKAAWPSVISNCE